MFYLSELRFVSNLRITDLRDERAANRGEDTPQRQYRQLNER